MRSFHGTGVPKQGTTGGQFNEAFRCSGVSDVPPPTPKHFEGPWGDAPSVAHQMTEFPNTWRFSSAEQYATFTIPEQLNALNDFLQQAHPADAPKIMLKGRTEQPMPNGLMVVLRYVRLQYMQIAPTPSLPPKPKAP